MASLMARLSRFAPSPTAPCSRILKTCFATSAPVAGEAGPTDKTAAMSVKIPALQRAQVGDFLRKSIPLDSMASRAGWQSNIDPAFLAATFVKRSPRVQSEEWQPVTTPKLIAFAIGAGLFFLLVLRSPAGFVFLVDHGNL